MSRKKVADKDLTIDSLPHTRRELFFDILKLRFKLIVTLGIFLALAALPMLAVFFLKDLSLQGLYGSYDWSVITEEQMIEYSLLYREQNNFWNLFQLPCFILLGLYLAGFMRVIRQLNFSKGILLGDDFKTGFKQNWKQYLVLSVIAFTIFYICQLISNIAVSNDLIRYLPLGISIVIFVPLFLVMMSLIVTYNLKFGNLIKNSLVIVFKNILWYLIFIISLALPIALFMIPYYFIIYIVLFILLVIYYPIILLANYLFNYASFDEYINKNNQPEYYHKGLY